MGISRRAAIGAGFATGLAAVGIAPGTAAAAPALPILGAVGAPFLHVMSFNVRTAVDSGSRAWPNRLPRILKIVRNERPALIGTQEGRGHQIKDLKRELGYGAIRHGREADGSGETCAILFDKSRLRKVDAGHLWLSDHPHVPGSRTWGNRFPRMMTWARFQDLATGVVFAHVNTHFDHQSGTSRRKSATMVRRWVGDQGIPALITGDFNTVPGSRPYGVLTKGAYFDVWNKKSKRRTPTFSTTNAWNPTPKRNDHRIDWIIGTGAVSVHATAINTWVTKNRNTASDHWPIQAIVTFG